MCCDHHTEQFVLEINIDTDVICYNINCPVSQDVKEEQCRIQKMCITNEH